MTKLYFIIITLILFSCETNPPEFEGLWVADFEKNYIKFTEQNYYIKFDYKGKSREIFGYILNYDTLNNVIELKYNKIFDDQNEIENFAKDEIKYFRYEIDEKIMLFNVSSNKDDQTELEGFFIKEPYY